MRARSFLDALGDDELVMAPGIPAEIAAQEASALERRRRLASTGGGGAKFWLDLDAIRQELEALWSRMIAITPAAQQYVDVRRSRPATATDIQRLIAADDRATVIASVTSHGPDGLAVIAVRSDSPRPLVVSQPADLARLSRFVLENLGSAGRVRELATDLEDLFHYEMEPLTRALAEVSSPGEILVVSPFAALNYVPLAALRIADVPLIERNPLAVLPNASLTRALRAAAGSQPHMPAAVFGDPTDNLQGARSEAELVARLLGADAVCGSMATTEAVSEALTEAGVVHIAAHAHFDSVNPLDSGVKLADGLLSVRDLITRSFRSLSLVTLSACETGISQDNPAQELLGLTRALLFAGADSLLVSLWKVPDTSTVDIMSAFYRGLKEKTGKAVALQTAILTARDKSGAERFDKWAGFELIGEWR